jgi:hypothetical protein
MGTSLEPNRIAARRAPPPHVAPQEGSERAPISAGRASPEEGAVLIRAFLRIKRPEVRAHLLELALSLADERPAS